MGIIIVIVILIFFLFTPNFKFNIHLEILSLGPGFKCSENERKILQDFVAVMSYKNPVCRNNTWL